MRRRAFLAALTVSTAGCSSTGGIGGPREPPGGATDPPSFSKVDEIKYPGDGIGGVNLTVDPPEVSLSDDTATVRISNESARSFETNLYDWRLHKWVDGRWWFLGTFYPLDEPYSVGPLGSHTREVYVDNGDLEQVPEGLSPSTDSSFTLAGVGAGTYAFSHVGGHGNVTRAVSTPFKVTGEGIDLVPLPPLETTRDDEGTLVVADADPHTDHEYEVVARRRADADSTLPLVPEWGLRQRGVRNTVPFLAGDVRTVVYRSPIRPAFDTALLDRWQFTDGEGVVDFEVRDR